MHTLTVPQILASSWAVRGQRLDAPAAFDVAGQIQGAHLVRATSEQSASQEIGVARDDWLGVNSGQILLYVLAIEFLGVGGQPGIFQVDLLSNSAELLNELRNKGRIFAGANLGKPNERTRQWRIRSHGISS